MPKSRRYFTLVLRDDGDRRWRPEFGDYSRAVVKEEQQDYTAHDYLADNTRIIESGDTQAEIDAAVAALNAEADAADEAEPVECLSCGRDCGGRCDAIYEDSRYAD